MIYSNKTVIIYTSICLHSICPISTNNMQLGFYTVIKDEACTWLSYIITGNLKWLEVLPGPWLYNISLHHKEISAINHGIGKLSIKTYSASIHTVTNIAIMPSQKVTYGLCNNHVIFNPTDGHIWNIFTLVTYYNLTSVVKDGFKVSYLMMYEWPMIHPRMLETRMGNHLYLLSPSI